MRSKLLAVALMLCASAAPVALGNDKPAWHDELRNQLLADKDCELNYLTDAKTFELFGKKVVEVRAHCSDKRAFDATRSGNIKQFELKSCEVVTC